MSELCGESLLFIGVSIPPDFSMLVSLVLIESSILAVGFVFNSSNICPLYIALSISTVVLPLSAGSMTKSSFFLKLMRALSFGNRFGFGSLACCNYVLIPSQRDCASSSHVNFLARSSVIAMISYLGMSFRVGARLRPNSRTFCCCLVSLTLPRLMTRQSLSKRSIRMVLC